MTEPLMAVVDGGTVTNVIVCDAETVQLFRDLGLYESVWGDADLVDVTTTDPRPGIGWTYDAAAGTFTDPTPPTVTAPAEAGGTPPEVTP